MAEQVSGIRLLTRGDDMGAFRSINAAIIDAFRNGILRNTSVMMPAPCITEAVNLLRGEPDLCLGLHVTLTSEWLAPRWGPVASPELVPSLLDHDGNFFRTPQELFERGIVIEELVREVREQLDLARKMGLSLTYLDEHMGVGWIFRQDENARLSTFLQEIAIQEGLIWDRALDYTYLNCETAEELLLKLPQLSPGTYLLITHPSYEHIELELLTEPGNNDAGHVARARTNNYKMLCHPLVRKAIQDLNIELMRYDQVVVSASDRAVLKQRI